MPINNFYKNLILFFNSILLLSCSNEGHQRQKITIGTTFTITNSTNLTSNDNTIFQWWVGNHPDNSDYILEPLGEKAIFTPYLSGNYDLYVSIRDSNNLEIDLIEFYYTAVTEKIKRKSKKIISDKALNQLEDNSIDSMIVDQNILNYLINSVVKEL